MRIYIYLVRFDSKNIYNVLLSKKEKKIKKNQFFHNLSYLLIASRFPIRSCFFMDEEKKWMLMTYYCPTHGNSGILKQIETTKKEISKTILKKASTSKN